MEQVSVLIEGREMSYFWLKAPQSTQVAPLPLSPSPEEFGNSKKIRKKVSEAIDTINNQFHILKTTLRRPYGPLNSCKR